MDPVPAIWGELERDDWLEQMIRVIKKEGMVCGTEQREEEIKGG